MAGMKKERIAPLGRISISKPKEGRLRTRHGARGFGVVGRQTGRHEHGAHGWESRGSSTYLWDDHRCDQKLRANRGAAVHGHQHGEMTVVRRSSRYGLRGVRVEEASNPGTWSSRHRSSQPGECGGHTFGAIQSKHRFVGLNARGLPGEHIKGAPSPPAFPWQAGVAPRGAMRSLTTLVPQIIRERQGEKRGQPWRFSRVYGSLRPLGLL